MVKVTNTKVLFVKAPERLPVPGEHTKVDKSEEIDLDTVPLNGGVLTKTLVLSVDPYMRGRMRDGGESYVPAFEKGKPIENYGVSVVLRSETTKLQKGDHVYGFHKFEEYSIWNAEQVNSLLKLENKERLPWSVYVGVAGMPGKTGYYGLKKFGGALKQGEMIYVNAAAGPVAQMVIQLAKMEGLYVVASAGGADKCKFVKEQLRADFVFDYREKQPMQALEEAGKKIDVYWENVGGEHMEAALEKANNNARFIICGMARDYNVKPEERYPIRNLFNVAAKLINMKGFIILHIENPEDDADFYAKVPRWIAEGKLKILEHVTKGIENADKALVDMLVGKNMGKAVVKVADDE